MTLTAHRYDHPAYLVRQLMYFEGAASASGTNAQMEAPIDFTIRNVRGVVVTAGTTSTHAYTIRKGTTSLGSISLGTSAAGVSATSGDLNAALTAGDEFNILKSDDATGVAHFAMEVEIPPGTQINV